jgi:putative DNA primase/helicase
MIDTKTLNAMYAHAKYSNSKDGIKNMIQLSKSEVALYPDQLDRDPWLFNVQNGTLDLRSAEIREHRREDFITKLAPVTYDPNADCPKWMKFLDDIFGANEELIGYIQRLVGYCITGKTVEHILPFLYGDGANGKSTFCETLMALVGADYAAPAAPDLLLARRGESHPTERADLFGKRMVFCVETQAGRRMNESLVKEMTGGDKMKARRMREDFWDFVPTHHVWLIGNHKPSIWGDDHGIWRRIKLIPFEVTFPVEQQDKFLKDKLTAELPGILNWAIAGCLQWQKHGMMEPNIVQVATSSYRAEEDVVGQFIEQYCELGDFKAPATPLWKTYLEAMPDAPLNQKTFGMRLSAKGFTNGLYTSGPHKKTAYWQGLRLLADAQEEFCEQVVQSLASRAKAVEGG